MEERRRERKRSGCEENSEPNTRLCYHPPLPLPLPFPTSLPGSPRPFLLYLFLLLYSRIKGNCVSCCFFFFLRNRSGTNSLRRSLFNIYVSNNIVISLPLVFSTPSKGMGRRNADGCVSGSSCGPGRPASRDDFHPYRRPHPNLPFIFKAKLTLNSIASFRNWENIEAVRLKSAKTPPAAEGFPPLCHRVPGANVATLKFGRVLRFRLSERNEM